MVALTKTIEDGWVLVGFVEVVGPIEVLNGLTHLTGFELRDS